ncbi:MAG: hypothetical protein JOY66_00995, partial [Acetobacteraceae bacterium]|nr:hypothetical protein [Acetobacteraceae bacterium]
MLQDLATVVMSEVSLRQLTAELRAQLAEARRFDTVGRLVTGVMDDLRGVLEAVRSGVYLAGRYVERDPATVLWLLDVVDDVSERGASLTRR